MPPLTDKNAIRAILRRDPVWGVYALGDLAPAMFAKTQWFGPDLTLVLHDFGTNILFAMGTASIGEALTHVTWPVHLQVQRDALDEVATLAVVERVEQMWRMGWQGHPATHRPFSAAQTVRLGPADVPALQALYADGDATGEAPDFFFPSMVDEGAFFGVYEGARLVSAAGTHLLARDEDVAAIGNVYTLRACRGRGLGRVVTAAVVEALAGIATIGLNVRAHNLAAIRVYESLGFVRHCQFYEALATAPLAHLYRNPI